MNVFPNDQDERQRNSMSGFFTEVDILTNNHELRTTSYVGILKDITKQHWKPIDSRPNCSERQCRKPFSAVLERPHHCRRCGELFCSACLRFRRRLNTLAHFDPDGQLYKVCKACFEQDSISDGQIYSHTESFKSMRSKFRNHTSTISTISLNSLESECDRLIQGFASSIGKSEIKRTLHEMKSMVSTADWMKSSVWVRSNMMTKCTGCQGTFGIMRAKKFCVVCGLAICKTCSCQDLLIFFPDNDQGAKGLPKLSIIRIIGCPDVEPEISLYLRICPSCKDKMIDLQVKAVEEENVALDPEANFLDLLHRVDLKFQKTEDRVKKYLPKFVDVVESLEDGSRMTNTQSNTKLLAKAQGDLADVLAVHVTHVQQLKKLRPKSDTQAHLLKNYIRAKCEFYMNNMCLYRSLKEKLSKSIPLESLDFIQRIMDRNAIISTHLYLRQLVYEIIHLTDIHSLDDELPTFLTHVEQEIEGEVKSCLTQDKENVEEHLQLVKEMVRSSIKKHKLLRLSQSQTKAHGSKYVSEFMVMRTEDILSQVVNQLQLASANRSFARGKKALEVAVEGVTKIKTEALDERKDFDFV